jgi:hypothetical protein
MDLGSLFLVPLANTSCSGMLLTTLGAPSTTWSAELYMNGKLYRWNQVGPRKAEIHLENAGIHLKIVQMNLQWIENDEINLKKLNSS